jgi:hypothetical protein
LKKKMSKAEGRGRGFKNWGGSKKVVGRSKVGDVVTTEAAVKARAKGLISSWLDEPEPAGSQPAAVPDVPVSQPVSEPPAAEEPEIKGMDDLVRRAVDRTMKEESITVPEIAEKNPEIVKEAEAVMEAAGVNTGSEGGVPSPNLDIDSGKELVLCSREIQKTSPDSKGMVALEKAAEVIEAIAEKKPERSYDEKVFDLMLAGERLRREQELARLSPVNQIEKARRKPSKAAEVLEIKAAAEFRPKYEPEPVITNELPKPTNLVDSKCEECGLYSEFTKGVEGGCPTFGLVMAKEKACRDFKPK